jgi:hypothetical protein
MPVKIETQIITNANRKKVWDVLTAFSEYQLWNPFIKSIKGNLDAGKKLTVTLAAAGKNTITFKPKVLLVKPNERFSWQGSFIVKGLFDGEHSFELIENENNTTTVLHSEIFSGLLVGILKKDVVKAGFEDMNTKLKARVESNIGGLS